MDADEYRQIAIASSTAVAAADITAEAVVDMFLLQYSGADSSAELYRRALRQFFAWVRRTGRDTANMTQADVVAYKKGLLDGSAATDGKGKSPLTASCYLTAVRLFYTWVHNMNGSIVNIAAGVKPPKRRKKFERRPLTPADVQRLLTEVDATATPRDKAIIYVLLTCGLRTIELIRADIKDMRHIGDNVVLYVQGKGQSSKENFVPLSVNTHAAILDYLQTRPAATPNDPLFTCAGNRNVNGRLTTRTISDIARQHLDAIGLAHNYGERNSSYTAHSLRHTFGCTMLRATGNFSDTQLLLRHASPNTTQQYVYHLDEDRRLKIAKQYNIDDIYKTAK